MPQPKRKPPQSPVEYYQPQHAVVAMAPDESTEAMNAALARVGVPLSAVSYLPIRTLKDFDKEEVTDRFEAIKAEKGEVAILVEPLEHYSPGMTGRWPAGRVNDEMYAWKAKSIRTLLRTRQKREAVSYGTVNSEDRSQGTGSSPVMDAGLLATEPGGEGVFEGWQQDADYFEQHPGKTHRLRDLIPREFGAMQARAEGIRVFVIRFPNGQQTRMMVPVDSDESELAQIVPVLAEVWRQGGMQAVRVAFQKSGRG